MTTYTEEEAAGKWCPMARVLQVADFSSAAGVNRRGADPGDPAPACNCIGSACMVWQWYDLWAAGHDDAALTWRKPGSEDRGREEMGAAFMERALLPRRGYCGASRP